MSLAGVEYAMLIDELTAVRTRLAPVIERAKREHEEDPVRVLACELERALAEYDAATASAFAIDEGDEELPF